MLNIEKMETIWRQPRPPGYGEYREVNWPKPQKPLKPPKKARPNARGELTKENILDYLMENPDKTSFEIEENVSIRRTQASVILKRLSESGLILVTNPGSGKRYLYRVAEGV